ncbi:MAG: FkbM family methyltransferase [Burkholderiales bacterium]
MSGLPGATQRLLDEFQRQLDRIETVAPMRGSYERIEPRVVEQHAGGLRYDLVVYHRESEAWYSEGRGDASLDLYREQAWIRPSEVVFDIGCNAGLITVWLGLTVGPGGRVLAFDPYPWNALATHVNCLLNGLENVTVLAVGLGDRNSQIRLPLDSARTLDTGDPSTPTMNAKVVDIAAFVDEDPGFLKIDIEGGEYELARADWSRFRRLERIFLELHPFYIEDRGLDTRDVLHRFADAGFALRYGHPLAAEADAGTVDIAHGGWWLSRPPRRAAAHDR